MEKKVDIKLSVTMIVRNESKIIETCLNSVKDADEIIICDTGSEDDTIEIAKKYTDKVYTDYKWNDNFSEARNHALSKATGDWVLVLDADDKLVNTIAEVKKVVRDAEEKGIRAVNTTQICRGNSNKFPRLFKRMPEIYWIGAIHNYLSIGAEAESDLTIEYTYSPSHEKDPDRSLRILKREVEKGGKIRELYYLAREYWYRKDYITAIYWWDEYLMVGKFLSERADACLMVARCYWALRKGETARRYCLMALNINANFQEALDFMAEMSFEHNAKSWRKYAELSTNENVLFIRAREAKGKGKGFHNVRGSKMYNDPDEPNPILRGTLQYYADKGVHEQATTELFEQTVKEGDTILDLGANLGYFSLVGAKIAGKSGKVYAFEPEPNNYKYLLKNIEENKYNIIPVNKATADKKDKAKLFICPYDSGHHTLNQFEGISSYRPADPDKKEYVEIETVKLDDFLKDEKIDVVKMDVEGCEVMTLKGMENIIKKYKPKMFVEFFPLLINKMGDSTKEFAKILFDNYSVFIIPKQYNASNTELLEVKSYEELMDRCSGEKDHLNLFVK